MMTNNQINRRMAARDRTYRHELWKTIFSGIVIKYSDLDTRIDESIMIERAGNIADATIKEWNKRWAQENDNTLTEDD